MSLTRKYKAFHARQKKMYYPDELAEDQVTLMPDGRGFINVSGVSTRLSQFAGNTMIPLESIGMIDVNLCDIHVGDLLKHPFLDDVYFEVYYNDDEASYKCNRPHYQGNKCGGSIPCLKNKFYEIIGNIYENPEL